MSGLISETTHRTSFYRMKIQLLTLGMCLVAALSSSPTVSAQSATRVYFGTYTSGKSKGIYTAQLNPADGTLTKPELVAEIVNPSFIAISPNSRWLFAANETGDFQGKRTGAVSAFAIDRGTGKLELLNQQPAGGTAPCHIVTDRTGKFVLTANYGGGNVAVLPVADDGRLGEISSLVQHKGSSINPKRQEGPHAHSINLDARNQFACAADLGLDKILIYQFDSRAGTLKPNPNQPFATVKPGAGPRHFSFHPDGRKAYVINELHSTVTAFSYEPDSGELKEVQTISTLPQDFQGDNSTAEVQTHPSGKFLYGSNRGHNSIAVFKINPETGALTHIENELTQGRTPRNFGIDPSGNFLLAANQGSDSVVVFRIDQETGELTPTGSSIEVPTPVCVKFLPNAR